ncbi:hypothetical protein [Herbidospora cretacea]|uniref:hypothetical protein n=1 Tax=Herbidospora cretacea TaxID=28444 RepID=UPI0004C42262|nr:hypothetical protein [Herbidospora cretacea]
MLRLLIILALVYPATSAAGGAAAKDPWPEGGRLGVYMCPQDSVSDGCEGGAATPEMVRAVRRVLEADPRLADLTYSSPADMVADTTRLMEENRSNAEPLYDQAELAEMGLTEDELKPEESELGGMFTATIARTADLAAVEADYPGYPDSPELVGSWGASVTPKQYWEDKGEFAVTMCGERAEYSSYTCAGGRGAATPAELRAVEEVLRRIDGAVVYPVSRAFTLWSETRGDVRESFGKPLDPPSYEVTEDHYGEMFVVDLPGTPDPALLDRLIRMPGVLGVH